MTDSEQKELAFKIIKELDEAISQISDRNRMVISIKNNFRIHTENGKIIKDYSKQHDEYIKILKIANKLVSSYTQSKEPTYPLLQFALYCYFDDYGIDCKNLYDYIISKINFDNGFENLHEKQIINEDNIISDCNHEFVSREYSSQPYGTCLNCGKTVLND